MNAPPPISATTLARFWARVDKTAPGGCWIWTGACNEGGYGVLQLHSRTYTAHVVAQMLVNGPSMAHQRFRHTCPFLHCVNPAHTTPILATTPAQRQAIQYEPSRRALSAELANLPGETPIAVYIYHHERGASPADIAVALNTSPAMVETMLRFMPPTPTQLDYWRPRV